ncbi:hypothetical protein BpHYR1_003219, partial [Brachionus plicatilis]
ERHGHELSEECMNYEDSVYLASLHVQRKEIIKHINKKKASETILIYSRDIDQYRNEIGDNSSMIINNRRGVLDHILEIYPGCPIMVVKNGGLNSDLVNGLIGKYVCHSEYVLLLRMDDGSIMTVPKFKQRILFKNTGTVFYRIQFPVVNATAQTIHKVQGLSIIRSPLRDLN